MRNEFVNLARNLLDRVVQSMHSIYWECHGRLWTFEKW